MNDKDVTLSIQHIEKAQKAFGIVKKSIAIVCSIHSELCGQKKYRQLLECLNVVRKGLDDLREEIIDRGIED